MKKYPGFGAGSRRRRSARRAWSGLWLAALLAMGASEASGAEDGTTISAPVAAFAFGGDADDSAGLGASLALSERMAVEADAGVRGGALRLSPRHTTFEAKTLLRLPYPLPGPTGVSFDFHVNLKNVDTAFARTQYLLSGGQFFLRHEIRPGRRALVFGMRAGGKFVEVVSPEPLTPGQWHHITAANDGMEMRLFIDGKLVGSAPAPAASAQDSLVVGGVAWTNELASEADALLDDLRIFDVAVNPDGRRRNPDQTARLRAEPGAHGDLAAGPHTLAFFPFDGSAVDKVERKARLRLGPSAELDPAGALRLTPRPDDKTPKTVLNLPEPIPAPTGFTYDVKVRIRENTAQFTRSVYVLSGTRSFLRYNTDHRRQAFEFGVNTPDGWKEIRTNKEDLVIQPNQWYRLTATYDGAEIRLYVDGVIRAQAVAANAQPQNALGLGSIGWSDAARDDLDGWIADLHISDLPLPPAPSESTPAPVAIPDTEDAAVRTPMADRYPDPQPDIRPYLRIPKVAQGPAVDGRPIGGLWERAAWGGNPVYLNRTEIAQQPGVRFGLLYDNEALYVGALISGFRPAATVTATAGDDGLERDDAFEVTLVVPGFVQAEGRCAQFKLNADGLRDDAIVRDFSWNADWRGAVARDGNDWSATFRIPFSAFAVSAPRAGDQWKANFGAFMVGYDYRAFLWSPVAIGHHHNGSFGRIEFGDENTPASRMGRPSTELGTLSAHGETGAPGSARLLVLPPDGALREGHAAGAFLVTDFDTERLLILKQSRASTQPGPWDLSLEGLAPGDYLTKIILADAAGRPLNIEVKPFRVERPVAAQVLRYPVKESGAALVTVHNLGRPGVEPARLELLLRGPEGERNIPYDGPVAIGRRARVELGALKGGVEYELRVAALSADGQDRVEETTRFRQPERPEWADADIAPLKGRVPSPWTPVTLDGQKISCWGRVHDWNGGLFPATLTSAGQALLAHPIRLAIGAGERSEVLEQASGPADFTLSATGDEATFRTGARGTLCDVSVEGSLEFDGFMPLRLTVTPRVRLDRLTVDIPLTGELARFVQPLPGAGNQDGAGPIPPEGVALAQITAGSIANTLPSNTVWISNERAGLFFACESTEQWRPPARAAIEILPEADGVRVLRLNLFEQADGFDAPRTYDLAFQAGPVRPFNPDWYSQNRYGGGCEWGSNVSPLEPDMVETHGLPRLAATPAGRLEMDIRNTNDLIAIGAMPGKQWYCDEKIWRIDSPAGSLVFQYSKAEGGMILHTPWGQIARRGNAPWRPGEVHRMAMSWGERLVLWLDGEPQGELEVKGLPLPEATLFLGSVSARYDLLGLRMRSMDEVAPKGQPLARTDDTFLFRDGERSLRSPARTQLHNALALGSNTVVLWEGWSHLQGGGTSIHEPALKNLVEDAHRIGLRFVLYAGFEISTLPDLADYNDECKALVDQSPNYYAPHSQNTYWANYGGPYQEYLLHHYARLKREIGIDGIYADGTFSLSPSDNPAYGCGYDLPDGVRVPTLPLRRIREMAKRFYHLFGENDGYISAHLGIAPPTMGFATQTFLGEHLPWRYKPWNTPAEFLSPTVAANLYSGLNTGVPRSLIVLNMWPSLRPGSPPNWLEHAEAYTDLHRMKVPLISEGDKPPYPPSVRLGAKYRAFGEWGVDSAEWIPYWDKKAVCSPESVLVSAWRRADGALLAVVANLDAEEIRATVDFSALRLSMAPTWTRASIFPAGVELPKNGDKVDMVVAPYASVLVELK